MRPNSETSGRTMISSSPVHPEASSEAADDQQLNELNSKRLPVQKKVANTTSFTSFRLSVLVAAYNERHVVEASLRR